MEVSQKFLIDSDILIDFLRGTKEARDFLLESRKDSALIISVVNVMEIYSGEDIKDYNKRKIIEEFLSDFEIILLDKGLAKRAGEIKLNYQTPFADAIMAATAFALDAVLVTKNIKHFSKIKGLKIKKI